MFKGGLIFVFAGLQVFLLLMAISGGLLAHLSS